MKKEIRTIVYDEELEIEAYQFEEYLQPFPNHFHEYYVIGFMEDGERRLLCRNREYILLPGNTVLFHPGDSHACEPYGSGKLNYRCFNISKDVMLGLAEEVTGRRELPHFSANVLYDEEVNCYLLPLHQMVMKGFHEFEKEETLLLLISLLIQKYGKPFENVAETYTEEIDQACDFLKQHFSERISLEQICRCAGLSKSTLLRAFTRNKGVTPYCYLEVLRIGEAKKLLEKGMLPVEAAIQTGFSDQSHFTNYFSKIIGLTPGMYREIFSKKSREDMAEEQQAAECGQQTGS